jgi:hypothetical protein
MMGLVSPKRRMYAHIVAENKTTKIETIKSKVSVAAAD